MRKQAQEQMEKERQQALAREQAEKQRLSVKFSAISLNKALRGFYVRLKWQTHACNDG